MKKLQYVYLILISCLCLAGCESDDTGKIALSCMGMECTSQGGEKVFVVDCAGNFTVTSNQD